MYEIFEKLLKEKGVKVADVCRGTGLKAPTFSDWKKGKSSPNTDKLILIANYFGVSVEYLKTGKESPVLLEIAETDVALTNMEKRMKEYALKLAALPKDKQEHIFESIDMLNEQ